MEKARVYDPYVNTERRHYLRPQLPLNFLTAETALNLSEVFIDDIMTSKVANHFDRMRRDIPRTIINLEPSSRSYEGSWFKQQGSDCVVYGVTNVMHSVNRRVGMEYFTTFTNEANESQRGWSFLEAVPGGRVARDMNIEFDPVEIYGCNPPAFDKNPGDAVIRNISLQFNAGLIKKTLDQGHSIFTGIERMQLFDGEADGGKHALSVVGYRIDEQGLMDVQLLDSNWGKIWTTLEHFSSILTNDPRDPDLSPIAYTVKPLEPKGPDSRNAKLLARFRGALWTYRERNS